MKETEITSEWIDRYNDDELDEVEKAMFQDRMQSNPLLRSEVYIDACLNQFLGDYGLLDLMNKVGSASQRKTSSCSLINSILIIASVLLLSMIAGIFYLILTNTGTNTMRTLKHINHVNNRTGDTPDTMNNTTKFLNFGALDSLPVIPLKSEHGLSENFESLAEFELLIGSVTRSGQFRLISPEMTASVPAGAEVQFAWHYDDKVELLSIIFLDNHGMPVSEVSLNHKSAYILKTTCFNEGLYYWKIMANDDIVLMGKLTILKT